MLKQVLEQGREAADAALEQLLPPATQHPTSIHQAMRHSVFAGGSACGRSFAWKRGA